MTELPNNLIDEIGKTGYDVETWHLKKHLSSVKSIDIGVPDAKLYIYIGISQQFFCQFFIIHNSNFFCYKVIAFIL